MLNMSKEQLIYEMQALAYKLSQLNKAIGGNTMLSVTTFSDGYMSLNGATYDENDHLESGIIRRARLATDNDWRVYTEDAYPEIDKTAAH